MLRGSTWVRWMRIAGWLLIVRSLFTSMRSESFGALDAKQVEFVRAHPNLMPVSFDLKLGWSASPLVSWHKETHVGSDGNENSWSFSEHQQFELMSWSFVTLVLGVVTLAYARALTKRMNAPAASSVGSPSP
jgi:hypothetical protein